MERRQQNSINNGRLAAALEDARTALARIASQGETVLGVRLQPTGARIDINPPRKNWLHGEQVAISHGPTGTRRGFRALVDGVEVHWQD